MKTTLKIVVALIALFFLLLWLRWMAEPSVTATQWALTATDNAGINNLRRDVGGLFLASALFCALWLWRGNPAWLCAAAPRRRSSIGCWSSTARRSLRIWPSRARRCLRMSIRSSSPT